MILKKETKFNINDIIWFKHEDIIVQGIITRITSWTEWNGIQYNVETSLDGLKNTYKFENELFSTKEEVVKVTYHYLPEEYIEKTEDDSDKSEDRGSDE